MQPFRQCVPPPIPPHLGMSQTKEKIILEKNDNSNEINKESSRRQELMQTRVTSTSAGHNEIQMNTPPIPPHKSEKSVTPPIPQAPLGINHKPCGRGRG